MISNALVILLITHVIGDFYFQNQSLADNKRNDLKKLFLHCFIYAGFSYLVFYSFFPTEMYSLILFSSLHLLIDLAKFVINKYVVRYLDVHKKNSFVGFEKWQYTIDQLLHIISIFIISKYIRVNDIVVFGNTITVIGIYSINIILKFALVISLLLKPTNITFKKLFSKAKPAIDDISNVKNGQIIGNLERLLVLLLLIVNQYSAIGIVFAAKSITRFNKISEDKEFAEYYLLGTLYSMLATLVIYFAIFKT